MLKIPNLKKPNPKQIPSPKYQLGAHFSPPLQTRIATTVNDFIVRVYEKLTAFLELELAIHRAIATTIG
jgi:hypothetical protein